jgi:hypothetical protein
VSRVSESAGHANRSTFNDVKRTLEIVLGRAREGAVVLPDQGTGVLPGLYPWLRFEGITREHRIEWYGIDLRQIDRKAAETYLEGEADFFDDFDKEWGSYFDKQKTLQDRRDQFANAAINLCESPIQQVFLAALLWLSYGYGAWVEIWDATLPFEAPDAAVVISTTPDRKPSGRFCDPAQQGSIRADQDRRGMRRSRLSRKDKGASDPRQEARS